MKAKPKDWAEGRRAHWPLQHSQAEWERSLTGHREQKRSIQALDRNQGGEGVDHHVQVPTEKAAKLFAHLCTRHLRRGLPPPKSCPVPRSLLHKLLVGQSPWPRPRLVTSTLV